MAFISQIRHQGKTRSIIINSLHIFNLSATTSLVPVCKNDAVVIYTIVNLKGSFLIFFQSNNLDILSIFCKLYFKMYVSWLICMANAYNLLTFNIYSMLNKIATWENVPFYFTEAFEFQCLFRIWTNCSTEPVWMPQM